MRVEVGAGEEEVEVFRMLVEVGAGERIEAEAGAGESDMAKPEGRGNERPGGARPTTWVNQSQLSTCFKLSAHGVHVSTVSSPT